MTRWGIGIPDEARPERIAADIPNETTGRHGPPRIPPAAGEEPGYEATAWSSRDWVDGRTPGYTPRPVGPRGEVLRSGSVPATEETDPWTARATAERIVDAMWREEHDQLVDD